MKTKWGKDTASYHCFWCSDRPQGRALIGADGNLSEAAAAEGFTTIQLL